MSDPAGQIRKIRDLMREYRALLDRWEFRWDEPEAKVERAAFEERKRAFFAELKSEGGRPCTST